MADFRLWSTITYLPPDGYIVAVSAVPEPPDYDGVIVETTARPAHREALLARDELMAEVRAQVTARGDRIGVEQ